MRAAVCAPRVRAVFGLPLYNGAAHLAEALESLLSQTRPDFALVLIDDESTDETPEIAERYAALDGRVSYRRNEERLGLARNWRAAFEHALTEFPEADLFAWASDHDVWHPRWLEVLVRALDEHPDAVLAFPDVALIEDDGVLRRLSTTRDTSDVRGATRVLDRVIRGGLSRGNMVYGLFRTDVVRRAGRFRQLLIPDKLLVTEVALQGATVRVPEVLWYRRPTADFGVARQRRSIFPGGAPLVSRAPWPLVHTVSLAWNIGVKGSLAPTVPQRQAPQIAATYLAVNLLAVSEKRARRLRKAIRIRRRAVGSAAAKRVRHLRRPFRAQATRALRLASRAERVVRSRQP